MGKLRPGKAQIPAGSLTARPGSRWKLGPCWGPWHIWLMLQGPSLGKELVWGSPKLPQGLGRAPAAPPCCSAEIQPLGQPRLQVTSEPQRTLQALEEGQLQGSLRGMGRFYCPSYCPQGLKEQPGSQWPGIKAPLFCLSLASRFSSQTSGASSMKWAPCEGLLHQELEPGKPSVTQ